MSVNSKIRNAQNLYNVMNITNVTNELRIIEVEARAKTARLID